MGYFGVVGQIDVYDLYDEGFELFYIGQAGSRESVWGLKSCV